MAFSNINIAKNEITGRYIKSDPPTQKYLDNYDKAFAKKTAREWSDYLDIEVDLSNDDSEKISYKQFLLSYT